MATIKEIRAGFKERLVTISDIRVYDKPQEQISPPAAMVGPPEVFYDTTMGASGESRFVFPIRVLVGRVSDRAAQDALDEYIDATGARSVKAAVEGGTNPDLGGRVDTVRVSAARNVGEYKVADISYLGVEFEAEVYD